ncbi:flavodoxin [Marichromatium bheemlicum]|uniref:Flavodoxin n=1 Tax=Marichromatium bheemlicum TaxID=365339 RepID=A0ABX1I5E3_9GAMM|nr:flavodoxin [Marichromatium bheemlicum]NKN32795.1 flavodoxin [Marichromatium bheemlicum]
MQQIGLFFATDTGTTEIIAERIQRHHFSPETLALHPLDETDATVVNAHHALIFGTPTVGYGDAPYALERFLDQLDAVEFGDRPVALFGLGDQMGYPDVFVDALGMFHAELQARGARLIGYWPTTGYDYEASKADLGDGRFCGLVLDEDNQPELTEARLAHWIEQIRPALGAV